MKRRMNTFAASILPVLALTVLAACGKQEPAPAPAETNAVPAPPTQVEAPPAAAATDEAAASASEATAETISEVDDDDAGTGERTPATVRPSLKLGGSGGGAPTSGRFKEGANYQKLVPAQPTSAPPGKVEVAEVFWYGCSHCFALDPAIESWRDKKPAYIEFVRVPAMWNDATRMHARVFYTAQVLGKLDDLHSLIFREIHVNGDPLNTLERIGAFFGQHGVSAEEFKKAFSSFAVESRLQRADFLNRRYRVQSVPMVVVNGKYTTDVSSAGGESQLFALIDELAAHEHGG